MLFSRCLFIKFWCSITACRSATLILCRHSFRHDYAPCFAITALPGCRCQNSKDVQKTRHALFLLSPTEPTILTSHTCAVPFPPHVRQTPPNMIRLSRFDAFYPPSSLVVVGVTELSQVDATGQLFIVTRLCADTS